MRTLNNISIEPNVAPGIDLLPLIGGTAWHSVTLDPTIVYVSYTHFEGILENLRRQGHLRSGLKVPGVAVYAHITGYIFSERFNADVTLFDVSSLTLKLGRKLAAKQGINSRL